MFPDFDDFANPFRRDPGPCPVCGTSHTTCTAPTVASTVDETPAEVTAAAPTPGRGPAFTTSSYRRRVHGRKHPPEVAR